MKDIEIDFLESVQPQLGADGRAHYDTESSVVVLFCLLSGCPIALISTVLMAFIIDMFEFMARVLVFLDILQHGSGCD
jgi:hypothetical protein